MSSTSIDLGDDLAVLLHASNQPVQHAAREFIVLELYRRGSISSGKAAQLLGRSRWQFIHHASALGIPSFDMTEDEWTDERTLLDKLGLPLNASTIEERG
jgi:predicted HTH domain antitoxin